MDEYLGPLQMVNNEKGITVETVGNGLRSEETQDELWAKAPVSLSLARKKGRLREKLRTGKRAWQPT